MPFFTVQCPDFTTGGNLNTVKKIGLGVLEFFSKHNAMGDMSRKHKRPPQAITG
jgi:hypothetical protein